MSLTAGPEEDERLRSLKARQGDPEALAEVRAICHQPLMNILSARGASRTEVDDILADLWADCVAGDEDRPSLLEKYSGKCTLLGWLATVATRRWIDLKRRQTRRQDPNPSGAEEGTLERLPSSDAHELDNGLVDLLRDSLQAAFARSAPEAMVLLRLVYLYGLTQREMVRMLGWNEPKVSRLLSNAMQEIQSATLFEVRKRDPYLELSWQDFVDLCETHQIGFL